MRALELSVLKKDQSRMGDLLEKWKVHFRKTSLGIEATMPIEALGDPWCQKSLERSGNRCKNDLEAWRSM